MLLNFKKSNIYYTKDGTGPVLVLLHGFLENSSMWKPFIPAWSKNRCILSIDLLGHGSSDSLGYIHTMELLAEMVKEVLNKENIVTAQFMGHSMGGYVALAFAEKYPQMTESLILLNSTPQADSLERKKNRDRAIQLVKQNKNAFISMAISNLFAEKNRNLFAAEIIALKEDAMQMQAQGIIASLEGMKIRKNRTSVLKKFPNKKIFIAGSNDPIMPLLQLQKIAQATESEFLILDGGHMSTIENREEMLNIRI